MAKVPKLVSGGGKAPAKFSEFTKRKTRRRIPFISVSDIVFPDIVFAYNPIKNFTNSKVGPDPVWSYTAPNYNDDGSYTGSTPWLNTDLSRWEWGGPSYTQFAQNSKFEGAGIGVPPSGWNTVNTNNGITRSIVGVGPGYIDFRFSGTCAGSTAYVGVGVLSAAQAVAALSETWTGSAKITLLSGDWSAVSPRILVSEYTGAGAYLVDSSTTLIGRSGQPVSCSRTLTNASVGKCAIVPFSTSITVGTTVDFVVRIEQPQLTKTATVMPYIATGIGETITCNSVPRPRIDAGKGLWGGPQMSNLFSGDSSTARSVTLAAQAYTLFVWSGSASCSYGTATPGSPLKFTATAGATLFIPTGVDKWMLVAGTFGAVPYVPPGATQPRNYATTGGNGLNIPMDVGMRNCLGASGASAMTLMHEAYMGAGSADLVTNNGIVSCAIDEYSIIYMSNGNMITKSYDRSNASLCSSTWNANEIHRRYVQTTPLFGGRFRVGYQRFNPDMTEITSGIQWSHAGAESTWATFDGSFNPLTYLRFGLNLSVPVWHRMSWMSNKTLFADEIALRNIKIANV